MIRRRFGRGYKTDLLSTASASECRVFALYLYHISVLVSEVDDDDNIGAMAQLFLKLSAKLNQTEKVAAFLEQTIQTFCKEGKFHCKEKHDSDGPVIMFDNSRVPYKYEEDKIVDRNIPNMRNVDEITVNMFRCLYASSLDFISLITANFLLRRTPLKDLFPMEEIPAAVKAAASNTKQLDFISKAVNLSETEVNMLIMQYRIFTCNPLRALYQDFTQNVQQSISQHILGISNTAYSALVRSDSRLRLFGFIDEHGIIEDDFIDCVSAQSIYPFFSDLLNNVDVSPYALNSFNVDPRVPTIMERMLQSTEPVSLLLYGKPGSGKTEFAKSLAFASGQKVFLFKNEREISRNNENNVLCRLNCLLSFAQKEAVVIVDEADTILQTRDSSFLGLHLPSTKKGTVNKMLEENKNKVIWIVNFTDQIDESTLRRFTYSYRFESMSKEQLRSIADTKLKPLGLPKEINSHILNMMETYSVTGASVDNVVKTIKSLGADDGELVDYVRCVLKENAVLINGKSRIRETVSKSYDLRALNASMAPTQIVQMIQNAETFAQKNSNAENGIRMLFYGMSGTGKTEFVRYIAEQLGKKILIRRASDILDKYVGGSEQNIRHAFEEAERTKSILLFDEADTFFADRNSAEHSWERTQVNEFLTQLEEFSGIVICTTNLKHIMDSAMNRRFHMIVEFKPLSADGIRCMMERYFGSFEFDEQMISRLVKLESITPGDFGVLAGRVRFMNQSELNASYLVNELCRIQDEKSDHGSRCIGFRV